jgi:hypothetical protein
MQFAYACLFLTGYLPLYRAWRANSHTTLTHAVLWAAAAWSAWGLALVFGNPEEPGLDAGRYLALCLTGASAIAVLGARKPTVGAWNFVVVGLLAVMLLPLGEYLFLGTAGLDGLRLTFLVGVFAVGTVNYLPTCAGPAAVLTGFILSGELMLLLMPSDANLDSGSVTSLHTALLLSPWPAWAMMRRQGRDLLVLNQLWHEFRDRFGLFWGQRVREQYNRSAAHDGLPGTLTWLGWKGGEEPTECEAEAMAALMTALVTRFRC